MTFPDERAALAALATGQATAVDLREIVVTYPKLWPVVAAYPGTDDPMLGWLRDRHDPLVDAALAKRAGAPADATPAAAAPVAPAQPAAQPAAQAAGPAAGPGSHPAPASGPGATAVRPIAPVPTGPAAAAPATPAPMPAAAVRPPMAPARPPHGPVQPPSGPGQPPSGPAQPAPPVGDTVVYPIAPSGQPGAPLPPATPFPAPPGGVPPQRGSGLKIALIAVALIVLLGGGAWVLVASGLIPGMSSALPGPLPSLEPTSQAPTPIEPPSPAQSEPQGSETPVFVPTSSAPQNPGVVCWSGDQVDQLSDCPVPQDKDQAWEYLRYVFPSSNNHGTCEKADSTGKSDYKGVTVMWNCELGNALLRYRFWDDPSDAERHYGRKFKTGTKSYELLIDGQPATGWVKVLKKRDKSTKRYILTMWLPDQRLSLSAEGDTTDDMWQAFGLVRLNPEPGHPAGSAPGGLPVTVR